MPRKPRSNVDPDNWADMKRWIRTVSTALKTAFKPEPFTVTVDGIASVISATLHYTKIGDVVLVHIPDITGTSDDTVFTLSGFPIVIRPRDNGHDGVVEVVDNGTEDIGTYNLSTGGVLTLYAKAVGTAWTATGTKTLHRTTLVYDLA